MATGKLLRQLIRTGKEGDQDSFLKVSQELIDSERAKNHHVLARDLERILYGNKSVPHRSSFRIDAAVPLARDQEAPLLSIRAPGKTLEDLVLDDRLSMLLDGIVEEHHCSELLATHGLGPASKLLFCGPPGCGKTLTSEVLASELGLRIGVVRIDSVVSSFLGETASNLRRVFDFAHRNPMVLLFDEFDALAKERSDDADVGEFKRVVGSFLQFLDEYSGSSIIIAATNHEQMLDRAIWRRFDELLTFELPDRAAICKLLDVKLRGVHRTDEIEYSTFVDKLLGMSHSDIERILVCGIKQMLMSGHRKLDASHINTAIEREVLRQQRLSQKET